MLYLFWIIIQICIESLPLSSSGHQLLFEKLFDHSRARSSERGFLHDMSHALHVFELCILAFFFRNRLKTFLMHPIRTHRLILRLLIKNGLASFVTAAFYFSFFARYNFDQFLPYGFVLTAIILFSADYIPQGKKQQLSLIYYILLGLTQAIALVPGISRFATTYATARLLGATHRTAFETCFSIQVPLIIGSLAHILYKKNGVSIIEPLLDPSVASVCLFATIISYQLFCLSEQWAYQKQWKRFAFYMIIPICISFLLLLK